MKNDLLDIVDENDVIIGSDTRINVHQLGKLHREIHVLFVTPKAEIIFQHRAPDKDTYPDLLDATVGGHVDRGMTYEDTAIKEVAEETGQHVQLQDLVPLVKMKFKSFDKQTGLINNTWRIQYGYKFTGNIADLKVEKGKAVGFEAWPIEVFEHMSEEDKKRFVPVLFEPEYKELFRLLAKLAKS